VGYLGAALEAIDDTKLSIHSSLKDLKNEIADEQFTVAKLYSSAEIDNKKIYFLLVPKVSELEAPESKTMVTEIEYRQPQLLQLPFLVLLLVSLLPFNTTKPQLQYLLLI